VFDINKIIKTLKAGGLVLMPSDTVYILAVDVSQKKAVEKLQNFKNRWIGKAISVAVCDLKMAKDYAIIPKNEEILYSHLLPGPFTLISRGKHKLMKGIEAEDGSLGIRIPDNKLILEVVKKLGGPISATSANLSGRRPHYSVESFVKSLSEKKKKMIDLIVDGGKLPRNKPSTVMDIRENQMRVLRKGELVAKNAKSFISKSERETQKIARLIFNKLETPIILGLSGDLGAGKTVFSKEIGKLMGITDKITSPTFNICNDYGDFLHMDLYRITNQAEIDELNFFNIISQKKIVCIEWIENLGKENLAKLNKIFNLKFLIFNYIDETSREIKL
jgi:L-threonylcarbamoyladenylate synthase